MSAAGHRCGCGLGMLALTAALAAQAPPGAADPVTRWFAAPAGTRGAFPGDMVVPKAAVPLHREQLFRACAAAELAAGADVLGAPAVDLTAARQEPRRLQAGGAEMPFLFLQKGERPATGWPLFLCLHGGGGNDAATGPHAWEVNTREWQAQMRLFQRVYQPAGLYFVPRMADDRAGRWWFAHNQVAFEAVIRAAILHHGVDPDRVYLMGISEGGYGAIRFAGNRPDRFAACGGMAAAEPLSTSPPETMRNVALRIDIGAEDTMFDRIGLARTMGNRLAELHAADPAGYDFVLHVQAGRGHGIDYALTPPWLATKLRHPHPSRLVWVAQKFDREVPPHHYWLRLDGEPATMPRFVSATVVGQEVRLTAEVASAEGERTPAKAGRLTVRLDDDLLDLDQPVTLVVNGVARPALRLERRLGTLARTLAERGDPRFAFPAEVVLDLGH